jgi:hypothetical protein
MKGCGKEGRKEDKGIFGNSRGAEKARQVKKSKIGLGPNLYGHPSPRGPIKAQAQ